VVSTISRKIAGTISPLLLRKPIFTGCLWISGIVYVMATTLYTSASKSVSRLSLGSCCAIGSLPDDGPKKQTLCWCIQRYIRTGPADGCHPCSTTLQFQGLRSRFDTPHPNLSNLHLASATHIRCQNRSCRNPRVESRSSSSTILSNTVMKMARPTLTLFREVDDCAQLTKERHRREWSEPSTM